MCKKKKRGGNFFFFGCKLHAESLLFNMSCLRHKAIDKLHSGGKKQQNNSNTEMA